MLSGIIGDDSGSLKFFADKAMVDKSL